MNNNSENENYRYIVFISNENVGYYDTYYDEKPHNRIDDSIVLIEIKQTKEDMEQEIEYFGDENNNAKHSNPESVGKNLRPFDLQKAREGKPVCTRDGRKARIICFDRLSAKPILALVYSTDRKGEDVFDYFVSGKVTASPLESNLDLMMLSEKKEGWILLRKDGYTFDNEEVANKNCTDEQFVAKVEWEE